MSMSASSPDRRDALLAATLPLVDPRLAARLSRDFAMARQEGPRPATHLGRGLVIAGHRGAGKSRVLPVLAAALRRPGFDLDVEIERHAGIPLRVLFESDPAAFRRAERAAFPAVPFGAVIAVGGGFLSLHRDLLSGVLTVEVPISEETYRERQLADWERPRLRPELSREDEVTTVFREREVAHRGVARWSLAQLLAWVPLPLDEASP